MDFAQVWQLFQPYLGNLPSEEDVYTLYNFRQDHIALLQDAEMVRHICGCPFCKRVVWPDAFEDNRLQSSGIAG